MRMSLIVLLALLVGCVYSRNVRVLSDDEQHVVVSVDQPRFAEDAQRAAAEKCAYYGKKPGKPKESVAGDVMMGSQYIYDFPCVGNTPSR